MVCVSIVYGVVDPQHTLSLYNENNEWSSDSRHEAVYFPGHHVPYLEVGALVQQGKLVTYVNLCDNLIPFELCFMRRVVLPYLSFQIRDAILSKNSSWYPFLWPTTLKEGVSGGIAENYDQFTHFEKQGS